MNVSYTVIGRNIRAAREASCITQQETAGRLGVCAADYSRLESGKRRLSLDQLFHIAILLNVPISTLLNGCLIQGDPQ